MSGQLAMPDFFCGLLYGGFDRPITNDPVAVDTIFVSIPSAAHRSRRIGQRASSASSSRISSKPMPSDLKIGTTPARQLDIAVPATRQAAPMGRRSRHVRTRAEDAGGRVEPRVVALGTKRCMPQIDAQDLVRNKGGLHVLVPSGILLEAPDSGPALLRNRAGDDRREEPLPQSERTALASVRSAISVTKLASADHAVLPMPHGCPQSARL